MRLSDSPEEASWRAEVRQFLASELPVAVRQTGNSRIAPDTELAIEVLTNNQGRFTITIPAGRVTVAP